MNLPEIKLVSIDDSDTRFSDIDIFSKENLPTDQKKEIDVNNPKDDDEISEYLDIPLCSGYYRLLSSGEEKRKEKKKIQQIPEERKVERLNRQSAWISIEKCPECGGLELFRFHDISLDRYHVRCDNVSSSVYKELESLYRGVEYKPSSRSKSTQIPLSKTVSNIQEYIDKVQEQLCGWSISI